MMTDRQYLYRGLTFISLILTGFFFLLDLLVGKEAPLLNLIQELLYLVTLVFATLWLRNWAITIGIFLYSIHFNLQLFKNAFLGWSRGQQFASNFWVLGFMCATTALLLLFIGFSKNNNTTELTKEITFKDFTIVIILLIEIVVIQAGVRFYYF